MPKKEPGQYSMEPRRMMGKQQSGMHRMPGGHMMKDSEMADMMGTAKKKKKNNKGK